MGGRGGSRNSSRGVLGQNSSKGAVWVPGPWEFSYTDKQKKNL